MRHGKRNEHTAWSGQEVYLTAITTLVVIVLRSRADYMEILFPLLAYFDSLHRKVFVVRPPRENCRNYTRIEKALDQCEARAGKDNVLSLVKIIRTNVSVSTDHEIDTQSILSAIQAEIASSVPTRDVPGSSGTPNEVHVAVTVESEPLEVLSPPVVTDYITKSGRNTPNNSRRPTNFS